MRIGSVPEDFNPADGQVSVYKFHYDPNILAYCFQGATVEWLHFVSANRKKNLFPQLLKKYGTIDIIGGKIADDAPYSVISAVLISVFPELRKPTK